MKLTPKRQNPERDAQVHVATMLRAYLPDAVLWSASLSGVPLSMHLAVEAKRMGMQRGFPDLVFVLPDLTLWAVEMKRPDGGALKPEQKRYADRLGERFAVCRSWPEVRAHLSRALVANGLRWLTDTESVWREAARRALTLPKLTQARLSGAAR